jgi:hypothetical protein
MAKNIGRKILAEKNMSKEIVLNMNRRNSSPGRSPSCVCIMSAIVVCHQSSSASVGFKFYRQVTSMHEDVAIEKSGDAGGVGVR